MRNKTYDQIADEIQAYIAEKGISCSVLLAVNDRCYINKGFGLADREKNIPNTPSTVFYIASLTKTFTAAAILMLEDRELLSTNDLLSKYLPKFKHGNSISIHNLLTHTTGLEEYNTDEIEALVSSKYSSPDDFFPIIQDKPLKFTPGEKFEYCNSNYLLLGHIIETISSMSYHEFIKDKILLPLNMRNSGFEFQNNGVQNHALGYSSNIPGHSIVTPALAQKLFILSSAPGGLRSTTEDLHIWDKALNSEKILSLKTLKKMYTPNLECYAYGWGICKPLPHVEMVHNGSIAGFSSHLYRIPEEKLCFTVLSNSEWNEDINRITCYFFQFLGNNQ